MVSLLQDDTLMEPSAFFDENVCNTTILHKAHMVEKYAIPAKRTLESKEDNKRLHQLLQQAQQDVSVNQSRMARSKCSVNHEDSEFPNVTNEELHISNLVTKVPQTGALGMGISDGDTSTQQQSELHRLHLLQTLQSL